MDDPHQIPRSPSAATEIPLPPWVEALVGQPEAAWSVRSGLPVRLRQGRRPECALATVRVPAVVSLEASRFEAQVLEAYLLLHAMISEAGFEEVTRYWAFLPQIHHEMDSGRDVYQLFNAGRYHAYEQIHGPHEQWGSAIPSSTGIGHQAPDLLVHALAVRSPVLHLHNPRQRPPHDYSDRYGILPPCFARGSLVDLGESSPRILVSGTASIRGEESLHESLVPQIDETMVNIDEVIRVACRAGRAPDADIPEPRDLLLDLHVYYRRPGDLDAVRRRLAETVAPAVHLELMEAEVCRPELLVEIEGTARLPHAIPGQESG